VKYYVADFETVTTAPTRVWAWGVLEIGRSRMTYDTSIETFFEWVKGKYKIEQNKIIYFHNLSFDAEFIFQYLLSNGFRYDPDKNSETFNCLITSTGEFYAIEVIFKRYTKNFHKVTFYDSLKKLPFSVEKIGRDFGFGIEKGSIDYHLDRPLNHVITEEEKDYLYRDIKIVADALDIQFKQDLKKMTIGSDALYNFKERMGKADFKYTYPVFSIEVDDDIRQAYRGGFTYLNPKFKNVDVGAGLVYDINSSYPATMRYEELPYGDAIYFDGKYIPDDIYNLYCQKIICEFTLKDGYLPTIQLKNSGRFTDTEYITESGVEPIGLWLTNVDLDLFFEHYENIVVHKWVGGWMFKSTVGVFDEYIDYWMQVKSTSSGAIRELAKLMLNSLYGKFASKLRVEGRYPELVDGVIKYFSTGEKERKAIYTPLSTFITSYARAKMIRTAQNNFDRFLYCDTDSLHILGTEPPNLEVHPTNLGAWKYEYAFDKARYLKPKLYQHMIEGKHKIKGAGMTDELKETIDWNEFNFGFTGKKKQRKSVRGGVILQDTVFTINE
jgi:hypothetical protein